MHNRADFWSPVPDWQQSTLVGANLRVDCVTAASIWLVSGNLPVFLGRHGVAAVHGPRQLCDAAHYALRIAPDRVLFLSADPAHDTFGWSAPGTVVSDVSDGMCVFDVSGAAAPEVFMQACEYPFNSTVANALESAQLRFAGFKVVVSRRSNGWRLHCERHWAPALWHWLQAHSG